jgi:hypothetical protein
MRLNFSESFIIQEHSAMLNNLNQISGQIKGFYWYFLASIGALGIGYKTILAGDIKGLCLEQQAGFIITICLISNIVFWLIGEYAVSHGFLYRFIQAKVARAQKKAWNSDFLTKDSAAPRKYIRKGDDGSHSFYIDNLLPDQFVPIYFAATWMIYLNGVVAILILWQVIFINIWMIISIILFCLPFILKLWIYRIHKAKKMFETFNIESISNKNKKHIFNYSRPLLFIMVILSPIFYILGCKPKLKCDEVSLSEIKLERFCFCEKYLFLCRLAN